MMKIPLGLLAIIAGFLTVAMFTTAGWDLPPTDDVQTGFRGTGMVQIDDREQVRLEQAMNQVPEAPWELDTSGPRAGDVYENVPVLGDLGEDQFTRLMIAVTEWVSPEEGCTYCHNPDNLADDNVYTKIVARRMFQMTQAINSGWDAHVAETGVTCYTCHRGQPVPEYIWFKDAGAVPSEGMLGYAAGQNTVSIGATSLHTDPFSALLNDDGEIRVEATQALPSDHVASIQDTERTFSLMIHMSEGLGVNCTYCHNSRVFNDWAESTPQRMTAWFGIQMVREINQDYLEPLTGVFPEERLGPLGDVAKTNCTTCHQGVNKPLLGAPMAADYPSLWVPPQSAALIPGSSGPTQMSSEVVSE